MLLDPPGRPKEQPIYMPLLTHCIEVHLPDHQDHDSTTKLENCYHSNIQLSLLRSARLFGTKIMSNPASGFASKLTISTSIGKQKRCRKTLILFSTVTGLSFGACIPGA